MPEQAEIMIVREPRQIKALMDPLRHRILSALCREPRTTKQVATLLGEPPTKLYRHVAILERLGLVRLVRTEPKRGTTEKYFEAVARSFSLGTSGLTGQAKGTAEELFSNAFDDVLQDIRAAANSGRLRQNSTLLATGLLRIPDGRLAEFQGRLRRLGEEFSKDGEGSLFKLLLTLSPANTSEE